MHIIILKVSAIFSDYDGTLVPAQVGNSMTYTIPSELEKELWNVAYNIPICMISSKDYYFLKDKVKFSKILSCVLGIETINRMKTKENKHSKNDAKSTQNRIMNYKLSVDKTTLKKNSIFLKQIHQQVCADYGDLNIELKYTLSENKILCGITMDGRNLTDWTMFSDYKKKIVDDIVLFKKERHITEEELVVQTYRNHPFLDLYACPCSKAMAYDGIANMLQLTTDDNVLYLGDSENDNPAFKKADISIGVRSDNRIKTALECKHYIEYENLALFLNRLTNNNFDFNEDLLNFDNELRN
ncbi:MAG: HAD-IIB family hydrolase [Nitrosopumilus sp.]|nr:HAD-IIB family hydrolase [Nitrosopumilus sp.]